MFDSDAVIDEGQVLAQQLTGSGRQGKGAIGDERMDDGRCECFGSAGHSESGVDRHRDLMGSVGPTHRLFQDRLAGPVDADHRKIDSP